MLTFTLNCVKVALPSEASLALNANSWKTVWLPRLRQLLEVEQRVIFVGVLISALFAVTIPGAPILFMGVCILTIGNLMYFLQTLAARVYNNRPFPWNWMLYLPTLVAVSFAGAFIAIGLLRWTRPHIGPYWELFRQSWKIIMVVSMGTGIVGYAVQEVQRKLQAKNKLLEQTVERSTAALAQQEQELTRACEIQAGLLPKVLPQHPNLELAGAWQPARTVGGDYFDVVQLDEDRLGICIGDVSGKGLTASLLMANLQAAFRAYATPEATPSAVCAKLNAFVCGNVAQDKFITFFYAIVDARRRTLIYENAGHCPALLLHRAGPADSLCGQGGRAGRASRMDVCGLDETTSCRRSAAAFYGRRHRSRKPPGSRVWLGADRAGSGAFRQLGGGDQAARDGRSGEILQWRIPRRRYAGGRGGPVGVRLRTGLLVLDFKNGTHPPHSGRSRAAALRFGQRSLPPRLRSLFLGRVQGWAADGSAVAAASGSADARRT